MDVMDAVNLPQRQHMLAIQSKEQGSVAPTFT